jgi:hypothetical protein
MLRSFALGMFVAATAACGALLGDGLDVSLAPSDAATDEATDGAGVGDVAREEDTATASDGSVDGDAGPPGLAHGTLAHPDRRRLGARCMGLLARRR